MLHINKINEAKLQVKALLEKLTFPQLIIAEFSEPEDSLPCFHEPVTGPNTGPDIFYPHPPIPIS
jgi:hypothetical protein